MSGALVVRPTVEVTSWLGSRALGEIKISQGTVTETASGEMLGHAEITVPATPQMIPSHPGHPLAAYGQELVIRRGFLTDRGDPFGWVNLGRFVIRDSRIEGEWLTVSAESIDTRLLHARWIVATRTQGTARQQARQITAGVVPIAFLTPDKTVAARSWEQAQPRREALMELCDSWGAVPRMIDGQLMITPASRTQQATVTLHAGDGGTLIDASPSPVEGGPTPNVVVASSVPEDESAPLQAMAAIGHGPRSWTGPYGQVTRFFASPLLRTQLQCQLAAETRLARLQAQTPELEVVAVTDPSIRLDSVVRVVDGRGTDCIIRVVEVTHALTAGREPGRILGQVISGSVRGQRWM